MYYTSDESNSIKRAGMDGSNPVQILATGSGDARGITTDFRTSKLFWANDGTNRVESSDLEGGYQRTVINANAGSGPYAIAATNDRIYWGECSSKKLKSSTTAGDDVITLHAGTSCIDALAIVPDLSLPQNRTNHCARNSCSKVCVLTTTSYRCMD